jgi:parallel beta-helix repeat protein
VNSSRNTLQSNQVRGAGANGFELAGGTENRLNQNTVSQSGSTFRAQGLLLTNTTNDAILNNAVVSGTTAGIELIGSSGVVVHGNTITNNSNRTGQGVLLLNSSAITVDANTISNNRVGIALSNTSNSLLEANVVKNSVNDGIDVSNSNGDRLVSNQVTQNGLTEAGGGILLSTVTNSLVSGNTVNGNKDDGIEVNLNSIGVTVMGNVVDSNGVDGIRLESVTRCTVSGNSLFNSHVNNIDLIGATANLVQNNRSAAAKLDGIHLDAGSFGNIVSKNTTFLSGVFDAEDDSTGGLTAGTANTWTGNVESKDNHGGGLGH